MSQHAIRRSNLINLYSNFVIQSQKDDPSASPFGLDKEFASRIQIANSSFSTYKSGARPIGDRIAKQIEVLMKLQPGWMDAEHEAIEPSQDEVAMNRFLKLATRAYKRANPLQRERLEAILKRSLSDAI